MEYTFSMNKFTRCEFLVDGHVVTVNLRLHTDPELSPFERLNKLIEEREGGYIIGKSKGGQDIILSVNHIGYALVDQSSKPDGNGVKVQVVEDTEGEMILEDSTDNDLL